MILLGCKPAGRNTEQHDIFFGIATELKELKQDIVEFWKEANGRIHIDAWREVGYVDGFEISVVKKQDGNNSSEKLFFLNLGGYKPGEFEEFHYKMLAVCPGKGMAITAAKKTAFYRHTGFKGATSHIDDKYGVDVDDVYEIEDILLARDKEQYQIMTRRVENFGEDEMHLGYLKLDKL